MNLSKEASLRYLVNSPWDIRRTRRFCDICVGCVAYDNEKLEMGSIMSELFPSSIKYLIPCVAALGFSFVSQTVEAQTKKTRYSSMADWNLKGQGNQKDRRA